MITDFSYLNTLDLENFIIPKAAKLKFELAYQPVTPRDYRFEMILMITLIGKKLLMKKIIQN